MANSARPGLTASLCQDLLPGGWVMPYLLLLFFHFSWGIIFSCYFPRLQHHLIILFAVKLISIVVRKVVLFLINTEPLQHTSHPFTPAYHKRAKTKTCHLPGYGPLSKKYQLYNSYTLIRFTYTLVIE